MQDRMAWINLLLFFNDPEKSGLKNSTLVFSVLICFLTVVPNLFWVTLKAPFCVHLFVCVLLPLCCSIPLILYPWLLQFLITILIQTGLIKGRITGLWGHACVSSLSSWSSLSLAPLLRCQTSWRLVNRACPKLTHLEVFLLSPGAASSPLFQHLHQVSACKFKDLESERQLVVTEVFIENMFRLVTVFPAKMCQRVTAEAEQGAREGLYVWSCVQEVWWATKPTAMGCQTPPKPKSFPTGSTY